jgi:D-alanyl-D-alanine carboxypeptidase/D-alanyl-D-alanine-endopeptidase (penicillin-binding protein 4)
MRSASRYWRLPFCLTVLASCARGALGPVPARDDIGALRAIVDSLLALPDTRHARWGVLIVDPAQGDTLYSRDAGKLLVPASNQKILTSAIALTALGPDYRYPTPVLARGEIRGDTLRGDLLVVGRGDPSVSDHMAGDAMVPLRSIADSLRLRGIRHVRGRVLAHGNAFPDANAGFGWQLEDFDFPYGAVVDELLFNEGFSELRVRGAERAGEVPKITTSPARTFPRVRVQATTTMRGTGRDSLPQLEAVKDTIRGDIVLTGTIPVGDTTTLAVTHRDPTEAYLAALREALAERGISVGGDSSTAPALTVDTLVVLRSPPLAQILAFFMKPSQNQIGEMLFKSVALARTDTGTARIARRIFSEQLRSWGAQPDGFLVWDGSGLSRRNLVSPETIVRVLHTMRIAPSFQTYFDAFPVAGVDGTLRGRMRSTLGEANVRGKTGTLGNVRSLSGYVTTPTGRQLIFSVLANNYLTSTDHISAVQDTIAVRLARLRLRGGDN